MFIDQDGAEPCGNSVAVHNLIRLAAYLHRQDLRDKAGRTVTAFSERLRQIPIALPEMISALMFYHESPAQASNVKFSKAKLIINNYVFFLMCSLVLLLNY